MSELPAYHGRTHAPGGTDPIPLSLIKSASFSSGLSSVSITAGSTYTVPFQYMYSNDSSFGYLDVFGSAPNKKARYIELTEEGFYHVQGSVYFDTGIFTAAQTPYVELAIWFPSTSTESLLINAVTAEAWEDGENPIYGEMLTADEVAHGQMVESVWFNFSKTDQGEDSIGIGVFVGISSTGGNVSNKNIGGSVVISRIGELLTETQVA